jgi:hypothetical protein
MIKMTSILSNNTVLLLINLFLIVLVLIQLQISFNNNIVLPPIYTRPSNKQINKNHNEQNNQNKPIKYNKCDTNKLQSNISKLFNDNGIIKDTKEWDIYMPCGYNYVEGELATLNSVKSHQRIFAIDGCDKIASKNNLWQILRDKYGRSDASHIMPETYIIDDKNDMAVFKQNYKPNTLYLVKKNVQRKEGIVLLSDYDKIINQKSYKVIQEYVPNLYILEKRKINIRLYLLVICHKGKVNGYLYNKGKCIYSNKDYTENVDNKEREVHLTSVNLDTNIYNTHPETLDDLKQYLGADYSRLWINILVIMRKMMNAIQGEVCQLKKFKNAVAFQLFGGDIIFNQDMKPYLLELNKGPSMKSLTDTDETMKNELTRDMFSFVGVTKEKQINQFIKLN